MKAVGFVFISLVSIVFLTGCLTQESRIRNEPFVIDNAHRTAKSTQGSKPGSIFKGTTTANTIFSDQRARNVGDIITVKITETSKASEKATTDTGRSASASAGIPYLLGLESGILPSSINAEKMISASTDNEFSGTGETTRSGSLSATITARVVEVLPNGNLAIEGLREVNVNSERKEILVQGIVRPKDIAYDNTILSTQIADAKVIYTGVGVVGEKQEPGWLARIFDRVWPF